MPKDFQNKSPPRQNFGTSPKSSALTIPTIVFAMVNALMSLPAIAQTADELARRCTGNNPLCVIPGDDDSEVSAPDGKHHAFAFTTFKDGRITSKLNLCTGPSRDTCVTPLTVGPAPGKYTNNPDTIIAHLAYSDGSTRIYATIIEAGRTPVVVVMDVASFKVTQEFAGTAYEIVGSGPFKGTLAIISVDRQTVSIFDPRDGHSLAGPTTPAAYKAQQRRVR